MTELHAESTTDDVLGDRDLSGRRFIVTGSSSGLGEESARALSAHGASVTMAARDQTKNAAAVDRIRADHPDAELEPRVLDLADLAAVRRFSEEFLAGHQGVDVLINNAGVMVCPFGHTADGFEMQFGTNHLGHFLLSALLADVVDDRIVTLSSGAHLISDVDLDDPNFERTDYDAWLSYGRSKSANALFALELARRRGGQGLQSFSVHPGMVSTELGRHMDAELMDRMLERVAARAGRSGGGDVDDRPRTPAMRTPAVGAATQVWAATTDDLGEANGAYLFDCRVGDGADVADHIRDADAAGRLWDLSEQLVGQTFS